MKLILLNIQQLYLLAELVSLQIPSLDQLKGSA